MEFITKSAIEYLNKALQLPAQGDEQDWELELANEERLEEFVKSYSHQQLSSELKFALMQLIVSSLDDRVAFGGDAGMVWREIAMLLEIDWELHSSTIEYWAANDTLDGFKVSPFFRDLITKRMKESSS